MATLTIRDLDDRLKAQLRRRAAEHGRSMEAEVRSILRATLAGSTSAHGLGTRIHQRFSAIGDVQLERPARGERPRAADLGE